MIIEPGWHEIGTSFLNGSTKNMNVNGATTPVVYQFAASGDVAVTSLSILVSDPGTSAFSSFGSMSALTNGVLIETDISSTSRTLFNLKDNLDIIHAFYRNQFGNGATDTLGAAIGFGDTADVFVGFLILTRPYILANGDVIRATVRDNLTGISFLTIGCHYLIQI